MKSSAMRDACVLAAESLRRSESVALDETIIAAHGGDLVHYVEQAAIAAMAGDQAKLARNMRDAQSVASAHQIELPGMEHAAVPAFVEVKEEGRKVLIPWELATLDQIDAEVRQMERATAVRVRVVGGYRATVDRLRALDVDADATGAEIAAMFPAELEG